MSTKTKPTKRAAARTDVPVKKRSGHHEYVLAVEKQLPEERVIAGPFMVEHASLSVRKEERDLAVKALKGQKDGRLVMHQGRAFVMRPRAGWTRAKQSTVRAPLVGDIWVHVDYGRVQVTAVTKESVDYSVLEAAVGHRNKVGPVGWFLREFQPEHAPVSQAGKYKSPHTRTSKITPVEKKQRLETWMVWHRHGLRGAALEKRTRVDLTRVRKWAAEVGFDLEGRA